MLPSNAQRTGCTRWDRQTVMMLRGVSIRAMSFMRFTAFGAWPKSMNVFKLSKLPASACPMAPLQPAHRKCTLRMSRSTPP